MSSPPDLPDSAFAGLGLAKNASKDLRDTPRGAISHTPRKAKPAKPPPTQDQDSDESSSPELPDSAFEGLGLPKDASRDLRDLPRSLPPASPPAKQAEPSSSHRVRRSHTFEIPRGTPEKRKAEDQAGPQHDSRRGEGSPDLPDSAYDSLGLPKGAVKVLRESPRLPPAAAAAPNLLQAEPSPARELSPDESAITLYAEVLLNIKTVTLFASLVTNKNHTTKAELATDTYEITVTHEGETAEIHLPLKTKGGKSTATLELPASKKAKEICLRLQIEEGEGSDLFSGVHAEERKANLVPWDGASLNQMKDARILCKDCRNTVVVGGQVKEWRDLPNENWAEMMDFWHCHKPDEHHLHDHTHDETVSKKGYAAGTRLQAAQGIGFVDLASLLLKEQDCDGVQLHTKKTDPHNSLVCRQCSRILGVVDENADGWRLWKWTIDITPDSKSLQSKQENSTASTSSISEAYTPKKWISARLLFLIENQGVRKFLVHPDLASPSPASTPASVPALLLWVFTPDLYFSSSVSSPNRHDPTRAMKVFYKRQTWKVPEPGEPEMVGIEEVSFPVGLYGELERGLEGGKGVLPDNARVFQGWDVAVLERFDGRDFPKEGGDEGKNADKNHESKKE